MNKTMNKTMSRTMTKTMSIAIAAIALGVPAAAQDQALERQAALVEKLQVERARLSVESRVTKGAPYSGEAVTETLQVLGDGNRISRRSISRVYRDSEGRTRRETLSQTGDVVSIAINDPVAQSTYTLDPRTKVAHRTTAITVGGRVGFVTAGENPVTGVVTRRLEGSPTAELTEAELKARQEVELAAAAAGGARGAGGGGRGGAAPMVGAVAMATNGTVAKEELGSQIVEGVMAAGTRSTTTIAAGAIGNVQPIHVVSEQWFSEDLKVLVMTRHSDPRSGDTTYRLTNVVLGEPQRALFDVPADYTLKDATVRKELPLQ
jgi:hypothetical protein